MTTMNSAELTQRRKASEAKLAEWRAWLGDGANGHVTRHDLAKLVQAIEDHSATVAASAACAAAAGAIEVLRDAMQKQRDKIGKLEARVKELESARSAGGSGLNTVADVEAAP